MDIDTSLTPLANEQGRFTITVDGYYDRVMPKVIWYLTLTWDPELSKHFGPTPLRAN